MGSIDPLKCPNGHKDTIRLSEKHGSKDDDIIKEHYECFVCDTYYEVTYEANSKQQVEL